MHVGVGTGVLNGPSSLLFSLSSRYLVLHASLVTSDVPTSVPRLPTPGPAAHPGTVAPRKSRPKHQLQKKKYGYPLGFKPCKTRNWNASHSFCGPLPRPINLSSINEAPSCRSSGSAPTSRPWADRSLGKRTKPHSNQLQTNNQPPAAGFLVEQRRIRIPRV